MTQELDRNAAIGVLNRILKTPVGHTVEILDLPGSYSLRARSPDEAITRDVVLGRQTREALPDAVVCVTDATNLGQHLRLAYNRQRQEEIIEEIEVILLSADLLTGEESRPFTPA